MQLPVKILHPDAKVPSIAHTTDAGFDLCSVENVTLPPMERVSIATGIALAIPEGYVGLIWDKSGVSHKGGIKTLGGVIDAGYRGEVKVGLINLGSDSYTFNVGDKLAQMVLQKIEQPELATVDELPESDRGEKGFGSTGK